MRRKRKYIVRGGDFRRHVHATPSPTDPTKMDDLFRTVTNETIVKFGPTFAMPGHLLFSLANDLRIVADLAEGGGGTIKLAEILTATIGDTNQKNVILKLLKSSNELADASTSAAEANTRAVWQQEICILW